MAVILDEFPHMAGTASSLAGTFRFGLLPVVGRYSSMATFNTARLMLWAMAFCATSSILFCLYASRPRKSRSLICTSGPIRPLTPISAKLAFVYPVFVSFM